MRKEAATNRFFRAISLALAFALLFCFFGTTSAPAVSTYKKKITGTCNYSYAVTITTKVNQLRSSKGVTTVKLDKELTTAAMQRAAEISVAFSHTRPDGSAWYTVNSRARAENIAAGYTTAAAAFQGWQNSSGHYANMVRNGYTAIGVGCFYTNGNWYWVQLFGTKFKSKETRRGSVTSTFTVKAKGTDPAKTSYGAPKLISVKNSSSNEMKITWRPVEGISDYEFSCKMPGASAWTTIKVNNIGYGKKLDTLLVGLIYKGKYSIRIRGVYKVDGKTKYTKWSSTKTVTMKK